MAEKSGRAEERKSGCSEDVDSLEGEKGHVRDEDREGRRSNRNGGGGGR